MEQEATSIVEVSKEKQDQLKVDPTSTSGPNSGGRGDGQTKSFFRIPLSKISEEIDRARKDYGDLAELVQSLKTYGLIHPIVVEPHPEKEGRYRLVAGGRRMRAALFAGWSEIPATLRENLSPIEAKEIELEENLQRKDINWDERGANLLAIHELKIARYGKKTPGSGKDVEGWNLKKTAEMVGKPVTSVQREIGFADKLRKRPELKKRVEHLDVSAAMKRVEMIEEGEKAQRLVDLGQITTSVNLKLGDSQLLIKEVEDSSIDLILTDPPFGIETLSLYEGKDRGANQQYQGLMSEHDNLSEDKVLPLILGLLPEFFRVLKSGSHFYLFHTPDLYMEIRRGMEKTGFECHSFPLIWDKMRTTNSFNQYNYMACYESIIFGWKPSRTKTLANPSRAILQFKTVSNNDRRHVFHKPTDLLAFLIAQSTQIGGLVLDPFAGSGETLVAAKQLKRSSLGFEINPEHWARAQLSLNPQVQTTLEKGN